MTSITDQKKIIQKQKVILSKKKSKKKELVHNFNTEQTHDFKTFYLRKTKITKQQKQKMFFYKNRKNYCPKK